MSQLTLTDKILQMVSDGYRIEFDDRFGYRDGLNVVVSKGDYHTSHFIDGLPFCDTEDMIIVVLENNERRIREMQKGDD